jgi:apolipoprotein N-acyltransferase
MKLERLVYAVATGLVLHLVVGLNPVGWLVWIAPQPLLLLAWTQPWRDARWQVFLAALIAQGANFHYFQLVRIPLPVVMLIICLQALLWLFVVGTSRRMVLGYRAWWTVFAYPALWAAVDTLAAHLLPDTNWGSLAYSQAANLPMLQTASLFGTPGLIFLVALVPSALAMAAVFPRELRSYWRAYAATALLVVAAWTFGFNRLVSAHVWRVDTPAATERRPPQAAFGMASIDDPIGPHAAPEYIAKIWAAYDAHVASLASQGAQIIVLPEKIGFISPSTAAGWQQHLSALAAQYKVWIAAGVGVDDQGRRTNLEWLLSPDGRLESTYSKHHMAPPERDYVSGSDFETREIAGRRYGLAICKDMHFATLGRSYGQRDVSVMLVPAWDFDIDREIALRTTLTRGVENGYAIVRSSREGMLSVTDAYGRVLGSAESRELPGLSCWCAPRWCRRCLPYTRASAICLAGSVWWPPPCRCCLAGLRSCGSA